MDNHFYYLSETSMQADGTVRIEFTKQGQYFHKDYGILNHDKSFFDTLIGSFNKAVQLGKKIFGEKEHGGPQLSSLERMTVEGDKVIGYARPLDEKATEDIKRHPFASIDYGIVLAEDKKTIKDIVFNAFAHTTDPWIPGLQSVLLSESLQTQFIKLSGNIIQEKSASKEKEIMPQEKEKELEVQLSEKDKEIAKLKADKEAAEAKAIKLSEEAAAEKTKQVMESRKARIKTLGENKQLFPWENDILLSIVSAKPGEKITIKLSEKDEEFTDPLDVVLAAYEKRPKGMEKLFVELSNSGRQEEETDAEKTVKLSTDGADAAKERNSTKK